MSVRFMPGNPDRSEAQTDRDNLAEIIDIRSKLLSPEHPAPEPPTSELTIDTLSVATKMLARKAMSAGELQKELRAVGCPATDIEVVIEEFKESLYLDDVGLARLVSEKLRSSKNASKNQIRRSLQQRLFEPFVIEEVLEDFAEEEETTLLFETAKKRARQMRGLSRDVAERRLIGFLSRRGWGGSEMFRAVAEALDGAESD
ncbi:MAG TPA: regulatory protein RecX [Microbacteriaceae bacterium]|nr:regulatory protein RecX [Microbacteriaceae bacterium]